jgi:hypothetical protein
LNIYSNGYDVLSFLSNTNPLWIPNKWSAKTNENNINFKNEIEAMCKDILDGNGLLVYFDEINRNYFPTQMRYWDIANYRSKKNL